MNAPCASSAAVRRGDPLDDPNWDASVAKLPGATFFHGAAWARVLHHAYGFRPYYLTYEGAAGLQGLLPLMEVESWITGRRGIALPFTDHCAPLGKDDGIIRQLAQATETLATERRWKHWELRGGAATLGTKVAIKFYGHTVALNHPAADLFARCDSAVRRGVRKAEAAGVTISFNSDVDSVRTFHRLLCQTRKRHGLPPQPFHFFEQIHRCVLQRNRGCVVQAKIDGRTIAGALFFHFGPSVIFKYGASDAHFQHLRPNNLVMWRAIEWHAHANFHTLDFGRTSLNNHGLRRFKLSWGADEHLIQYIRYHRATGTFVSMTDRASGWHSRLFRFVPLPLARLIGAAAYRHMA